MAADREDEGAVREDPPGLGEMPEPDAPSRRPRPRVLALLGEFFRMSRTTAILLVAFVMLGSLYLVVRAEPVVQFGTPGSSEDAETAPEDPTEENGSEPTDATTGQTSPGEVTSPSSSPGTPPVDDDEEATTSPGGRGSQAGTSVPEEPGAGSETPTGPAAGDTGPGGGDGEAGGGGVDAATPDAE